MRIPIVCSVCSAENRGIAVYYTDEMRDDGVYIGSCPRGHRVVVATQTLRHEMLFEVGLSALSDGYPREAISSFAAAVERFYEFAVMVLLRSAAIPQDVVATAWKIVSSQSERQFGAFVFLWLRAYGEMPTMVSRKMVELRNEVIHKGVLPTRESAVVYGENAYNVISDGIHKLRASHLDAVSGVLGEQVAVRAARMDGEYPRGFMVTPTVLNVIRDTTEHLPGFGEILKNYRKVA